MSLSIHPRLMLAALVMSGVLTALLLTAITFEFLIEEMAKIVVVPVLVAATFTSIGLTVIIVRSSTS